MKKRIFVDSDIILDVLAEREKYCISAAELFELGNKNEIELFTTAVILANVYYFLRKFKGIEKAKILLKQLRLIINVLTIEGNIVDMALGSEFGDFEDGLQYFTAKENDISVFITRNIKHYKVKDIIIQTAEEYITSNLSTG